MTCARDSGGLGRLRPVATGAIDVDRARCGRWSAAPETIEFCMADALDQLVV